MSEAQAARFDYNDPVFRHGTETHGLDNSILRPEFADVHPFVADGIAALRPGLILDLGCGPTKLGALLDERKVPWVGLDLALPRLRLGHGARVLGNALSLPFAGASFDAVATLYTLYHFENPLQPLGEASRVLKPGGTFVTCAPGADDDPELADYLPSKPPETFDSDIGVALVAEIFEVTAVNRWDMALYRLPTREAVWNYLVSRQTPTDVAAETASKVGLPLWLTTRGATIWGRKRS